MFLCITIVSSFPLLHSILLYEYNALFILLLNWGYFLCQAIIINAAVNILTQSSGAHVLGILQGIYPGVKLFGCRVCTSSRLGDAEFF